MRSLVARVFGFLSSLALLMALASPSFAGDHHKPKPHSAPEIGTVGLGATASLLIGGTLLLESRRRSRAKR